MHESLVIGHVEEVSPSTITVSVAVEAPHGTSFAHGSLQRFPRVNGFVVLPCEDGAILAIVVWIGVDAERIASNPSAEILGLPIPRRRLRAVPLGLLRVADESGSVQLERGALLFPSVGDPVRLPTAAEAAAAIPTGGQVRSGGTSDGLFLGYAPMAGRAPVKVSANRLFGRHLAILGNTGSGKSCSLTHLLRESAGLAAAQGGSFRAIVLDLNGEYGNAFDGLDADVAVRRYAIEVESEKETEENSAVDRFTRVVRPLRVPYWLWNYREWHAFADPSGKSQAPVLRQALQMLRTSSIGGFPTGVVTLVMGRRVVREFKNELIANEKIQSALSALDKVRESVAVVATKAPDSAARSLDQLAQKLATVLDRKRSKSPRYTWEYQVAGPSVAECQDLEIAFDTALAELGVPDMVGDVSTVDSPAPFDAADLVDLLGIIAVNSGADVGGWIMPMQERLAIAMSDQRMVRTCGMIEGETLTGWIEDLLGTRSQLTILDLSLVPAQAQHVVASVIARMLLETLERHRRLGSQVPVILAVEEAHTLMRRRAESSLGEGPAAGFVDLCRESFERIGREGRKFGLSLVVSSQRPSELSETVLSQCNSYLIHRIVNSRDQDFVRRLVSDNLGNLLSEVASYPARTALLVGGAAEIPVLLEIAELDTKYRPNSSNPDFEGAWRSGAGLRTEEVAAAWIPSLDENPPPTEEAFYGTGRDGDDDPPF